MRSVSGERGVQSVSGESRLELRPYSVLLPWTARCAQRFQQMELSRAGAYDPKLGAILPLKGTGGLDALDPPDPEQFDSRNLPQLNLIRVCEQYVVLVSLMIGQTRVVRWAKMGVWGLGRLQASNGRDAEDPGLGRI